MKYLHCEEAGCLSWLRVVEVCVCPSPLCNPPTLPSPLSPSPLLLLLLLLLLSLPHTHLPTLDTTLILLTLPRTGPTLPRTGPRTIP